MFKLHVYKEVPRLALITYRVRNEIQQYLDENKIPRERLGLVNINHWQDIYRRAVEAFVEPRYRERQGLHWLSLNGHIREDVEPIDFYDSRGCWEWVFHLSEIIPDEKAYLFIEGDHDKMWIYEGCIPEIVNLLYEGMYDDEYCIIDKKFKWIICFNHHDIALFLGTGLNTEAIKKLKQKED